MTKFFCANSSEHFKSVPPVTAASMIEALTADLVNEGGPDCLCQESARRGARTNVPAACRRNPEHHSASAARATFCAAIEEDAIKHALDPGRRMNLGALEQG